MFDLIIIGAGPAGISAAFEAQKLNLNYLVLEKNLIGNTIYQYPVGLTVFSTVNELELQPNTLFPAREKPTREELLSYYTRFVLENNLNIQWEEAVLKVEKLGENRFRVISEKGEYEARTVLFAFGAMQLSATFRRERRRFAESASSFSRNLPVCQKKRDGHRRRKFGGRSRAFSGAGRCECDSLHFSQRLGKQ